MSDERYLPTMQFRVRRVRNYSYAETRGVVFEDTLQQLWVEDTHHGYRGTEWRNVPIVEEE